ncbi:MAG: acyl-ACP desaturase [Candidatus Omnitrophica bacterium]|nr:acyl-ACP desaturase [Candidatus Omnitrophota bacterium]
MDDFVRQQLVFLKPVADSWQPQDLLPDMTSADWRDNVHALRDRSAGMSDEALVVLVGNLVTEEALPSYQTWLNRVKEISDQTGADDTPWALWTRGWTAEENRHGDVLNKYLYLSGRVDMRAVEITIQHLIRNGFDLKSDNDPYKSLVYASFQERATKISHANTGKLAEKCGDVVLGRICATIAGDEARHEEAYKRFFGEVLRVDAARAVIAFAFMMRQKIAMPARLMSDGTDRDIFAQFAVVAQKSGVYTTRDYAAVIEHLVDQWKIGLIKGLTGEAAAAQDYLCGLSEHYLSKADRIEEVLAQFPQEPFRWIFDRSA